MKKDEMISAWEQRKTSYANHWKTGLATSCCADPLCCITALACPCCTSYALRKRTLYDDLNNYQCCGGFFPCAGRCGENKCPELCLCLEVTCCFGSSVAVTRWMLQDELRIQNTACDNCLLGTMLFLQQLACLCQVAACITGDETLGQLADFISFLAEVVWWSVCACLQTQHKVQLDERDKTGGAGVVIQQSPMQAPVPQGPPQPYATGVYGQQGYGSPVVYPPGNYPQPIAPYGQQQMYR